MKVKITKGSRVQQVGLVDPLGLVKAREQGTVIKRVKEETGMIRYRVHWDRAGVLDSLPNYFTILKD